ncbi:MarR family winged helix-turn-helix transcriptional regulator [Shimia sp.]|uniref:MarR family winged helix-turn-helix transcriptional regulator n=1 Tax=Shimia sp. TaxID=1954381 RepID=UPI0035651099
MARLFARHLQQALRAHGVAPAQFMVLLELWEEDGLTQADLVARLDVEQATMANTLARMQRDGLILRRPSTEDRRVRRILLTDRARDLQDVATRQAQRVNETALAELTQAERASLLRLIGRVISALQKA